MLETSVRALENHVILAATSNSRTDDLFSIWHEPTASPVSSSFSSAMSITALTPTTDKRASAVSMMFGERSLPRRHHTIGNIRYDSSAYKTVSFQDDEPKSDDQKGVGVGGGGGGAGYFRHIKQGDKNLNYSEAKDVEEEVRLTNNGGVDQNSLLEQQQQRKPIVDEDEEEDKLSSLIEKDSKKVFSVNISRSKSFSDVTIRKKDAETWRMTSSPKRREEPTLRSKSFKDISSKPKSNRFSWDVDAASMGGASSLRDFPSHLRASLASLTSLDLHSSAAVSPDVPAKELASKPGVLSGTLEIKSKSGFKTFKKYWCALDGPAFYIYGRDKDPKAKQAFHLSGYKVKVIKTVESGSGLGNSFRSEVKKKGRQFELTPPSNGKLGGRQFAATSKEEAEAWVQKIQEALDNLSVADQLGETSSSEKQVEQVECNEGISELIPFWRQQPQLLKQIEYFASEDPDNSNAFR